MNELIAFLAGLLCFPAIIVGWVCGRIWKDAWRKTGWTVRHGNVLWRTWARIRDTYALFREELERLRVGRSTPL